MANRYVKYHILKEEDGLIFCERNYHEVKQAPEGYYWKTKSGRILGNILPVYKEAYTDFTGEYDATIEMVPEEEVELVKEDD